MPDGDDRPPAAPADGAVPSTPPPPPPDSASPAPEPEHAPGPPVPPPVRRRRRRRQLLGIAAVLVVLAVPITFAVVAVTVSDGDTSAQATDDDQAEDGSSEGAEEPEDPEDPSADGQPEQPPEDPELEPPDPGSLEGLDAVLAEVLIDIDASERTMTAFQDDVAELLGGGGSGDPAELGREVSERAAEGRDGLERLREPLEQPVDEPAADEIRAAYLAHLESWVSYLDAIADDPGVLGSDGYRLDINTTADRFARTVEEELPEDLDAEVARFAEGILERGFRTEGQAEV